MKQNLPEHLLESMRWGLSDEEAIAEGLVDPLDLGDFSVELEDLEKPVDSSSDNIAPKIKSSSQEEIIF